MHIGPPSFSPKRAARSHPTASITARTSSILSSSVGTATGSVRESGATFIEPDHSRERCESIDEVRVRRVFPRIFDMADVPRRPHEIDRATADDLVGDVELAALRVLGYR